VHRPHSRGGSLKMLRHILGQMPGATSLDDLLDRTIAAMHQAMGNSVTAILQLWPSGHELYARTLLSARPYLGSRILPIEIGLLGAAARTLQTVVANDALADPRFRQTEGWATRAQVCVPIVTRDGLWGVLSLESERSNAFPPRLVQIGEIVAQQLAIAVENTALVDQARDQAMLLERRASELSQVLTLNTQLRISMDLDALLQHHAEAIREVMGFQAVVVNLVDVAHDRVWVVASAGLTPGQQALLRDATYEWSSFLGEEPERFRVSQSYFFPAEANTNRSGVIIRPELDERAPHEWQADDMLMIPIATHRGEILGIFSVDNPLDRRRPSLPTIQGLEIFAAHTAAAIENVRLFAQSQETLAALQRANEEQARLLDQVRRAQAELITASKLAAVGTLAAGVAHEFNNLLAGMHGFAELGLQSDAAEKDEALGVILRTCQRGVQITRQLLAFARQGNGVREPARVDEIAESALQLIRWELTRTGLSVVRQYQSQATILAETGQLMQVVLNLLTNARDATAPGGTVTVATREEGEWIEIAVADTGSGIAESIRDRIFDPFVTTKGALGGGAVSGTGLGLSVSYGIVRAHGGHLLVESALGRGSTFRVLLPRPDDAAAPHVPDVAEPAARAGAPLRILVVDDEDDVRVVLARLLARAGHSVAQASGAAEALEYAARERWDVIVSDVTMPQLDGPALVRRLRERGDLTPVVLVSGRVDADGLAHAQASGAVAVLAKPFDTSTLLAAVAAAAATGA
jgi:signal transduction histidine kinase/putative methionine-R-sulfoxide reductase with GAF domain